MMRKMVFIAGLTIGLMVIPFLLHAEIYKWVDDKGTIHFTDDYSNVPSSYPERAKVKVEVRKDIREKTSSEPKKAILGVKEDRSKSYVERDEVWREEKIHSWTEKLEEATANYENAQRAFLAKAEELGRRRFGSPTQYKFDIIRLDELNQERMRYRAQMEEADNMVRKFSSPDFWSAAGVMGEDKGTDIYGMGEDWWRDKIRPWRERQEELDRRYEKAEETFTEMAVDLSKRRYGNRHTIKAKILELDWADQEALQYQSQIAENEEVLDRIYKDAEESGADPEWLK